MNQNDIWQAASAWNKLEIGWSHGTRSGLRQEQCEVTGEAGDIDGVDDEAA